MVNESDNSHEYNTANPIHEGLIKDNPRALSTFIQKNFTFRNTLTLIFVLLNIVLLIKVDFYVPLLSGKAPLQDFDHYYQLSSDLLKDINPYEVPYMRAWGPPLVFLYYLPFQLLDLSNARSLTTAINIGAGILAVTLLTKNLFSTRKLTSFLGMNVILFSSFPGRFSLEMGQPNFVFMLLVTTLILSKSINLRPLLLGILTFKTYFLLTFFTYYKKSSITFYKSVFSLILIAFLASLIIKPNLYFHYYKTVLPQLLSTGSQISQVDYYNQTYFSTLARVGVTFPDKNLYAIITVIGIYLIYFIGNFEIAVILSLILSIVSWQHYFVVLFPIYIKSLRESPKNFYDHIFVSILIGFWWIEFPWLHNAYVSTFNGLLASHYFLSALLLAIYIILLRTRNPRKSLN